MSIFKADRRKWEVVNGSKPGERVSPEEKGDYSQGGNTTPVIV